MGRHSKCDIQRIGPMLWVRFLKRHFHYSSLARLNAQLLLPVTPHEVFEFGENPEPLPLRLAPKIFERAHNLGRNPDGAYTPEINGPAPQSDRVLKFNLYQRVTQRVPESKYWLLKELEPFLQEYPPPIDITLHILRELLAELELTLLEGEVVATWERIHESSLRNAEQATIRALSRCPLPEYVALNFALFHLCVWQDHSRVTEGLSHKLRILCRVAGLDFLSFLGKIGIDIETELKSTLDRGLLDGEASISQYGARSMSKNARPPNLWERLILVSDTEATRRAIRSLTKAHDQLLQLDYIERMSAQFLQEFVDPGNAVNADPVVPPGEDSTATAIRTSELIEAGQVLAEAARLVSRQFSDRALRILAGYQDPSSRLSSSGPFKTFSKRH